MSAAIKGLSLTLVFIINLISYAVIFPLATWNHNVVLIILSLAVPFILKEVLKRNKAFVYKPKVKSSESILLSVVALVVFGLLLWNHFIFLTFALVVFLAVRQAKIKKRRF